MNLLALQNKVIEKLKERSDPRHWTIGEITDNINRGCRKFAGDSKAQQKRLPLYAVDIANGMFAFPDRLLSQSGVYWDNIKLDMVDSDYLDNLYSSYSQAMKIGDSPEPLSDWRGETADQPAKCIIEDGMVRMFPIPNSMVSATGLRDVQSATLTAGTTDIVVAGPLPAEQDDIDLYLNGVYQNKDQWSIISATTLRMVGSQPVDLAAEVVFFVGVTSANTKIYKYNFNLDANQVNILLPRPYVVGDNAISLKLSGVSQAPSAFTESSAYSITINGPTAAPLYAEVTLYERVGAFPATVKCETIPTEMVAATDNPDLPGHLENFHDAIWAWALAECYSREGQEKNMGMAQFYGARYDATVNDYKNAFGTPILIAPRDAWRI